MCCGNESDLPTTEAFSVGGTPATAAEAGKCAAKGAEVKSTRKAGDRCPGERQPVLAPVVEIL